MTDFPQLGQPWSVLKLRMESMRHEDVDWRGGRAPLHVYFAGEDVQEVVREAYTMFMVENALSPVAFPSLECMEREVIGAAIDLFDGPPGTRGSFTSGGTESIILAVKAARDRAQTDKQIVGRGEILLPKTAHPAFDKAAQLLGLDVVRVEIGKDYRADVRALERAITERTILIVASAPSLPFGLIDPVEAIGALAQSRNLWFHVDCCLGGFIAPFARKLGYPVPRHDFSVPGVRSISADLHKFGYAAKGASTLLLRDARDWNLVAFEFSNWPKGKYRTASLLGTRSGGPIAASWAVIQYLGQDGFLKLTDRVMKLRDRYTAGIEAIAGLRMLVRPDLSIVAYTSDSFDIMAVGDLMGERGWYMSRVAHPPSLHQTINLAHESCIDVFLADLAAAAEQVTSNALVGKQSEVMTY